MDVIESVIKETKKNPLQEFKQYRWKKLRFFIFICDFSRFCRFFKGGNVVSFFGGTKAKSFCNESEVFYKIEKRKTKRSTCVCV